MSENTSVSAEAGAWNVGPTAVALLSVTVAPEVWVQLYVSGSPSASALPEPSRVTVAPVTAFRSSPASATGAVFAGAVTDHPNDLVAVSPSASVAVTVAVPVPAAVGVPQMRRASDISTPAGRPSAV